MWGDEVGPPSSPHHKDGKQLYFTNMSDNFTDLGSKSTYLLDLDPYPGFDKVLDPGYSYPTPWYQPNPCLIITSRSLGFHAEVDRYCRVSQLIVRSLEEGIHN